MNLFKSFLKPMRRWVFNNRLKNVGTFQKIEFPKYPREEFELVAWQKLLKYQTAFKKLQELDPAIEHVGISNYNNTLSVDIKDLGTYKISVDIPNSLVYLFSPYSGTYSYYYKKDQDQWANTKDEHYMEDLVTRELLRFCKGYLDL